MNSYALKKGPRSRVGDYNQIAIGVRFKQAGLSQAELARRAGARSQTVNRIVRGLARPRRRLLDALSSVLRCCPADIVADFYGADFDPRRAEPRMDFERRLQQLGYSIDDLEKAAGVNRMIEQWMDCANIPFQESARKVAAIMNIPPAQIIVDLVCTCRDHEMHRQSQS